MYLEPTNLLPVEYETWSFDLDKANKALRQPEWKLQYKFSETYGLKDLSPTSFMKYAEKMITGDGKEALKY